jgi:hypothetical protein
VETIVASTRFEPFVRNDAEGGGNAGGDVVVQAFVPSSPGGLADPNGDALAINEDNEEEKKAFIGRAMFVGESHSCILVFCFFSFFSFLFSHPVPTPSHDDSLYLYIECRGSRATRR